MGESDSHQLLSVSVLVTSLSLWQNANQGLLEKGEFSLAYGSGGVKVQPERWQMWQQRAGKVVGAGNKNSYLQQQAKKPPYFMAPASIPALASCCKGL